MELTRRDKGEHFIIVMATVNKDIRYEQGNITTDIKELQTIRREYFKMLVLQSAGTPKRNG